MRYEKLVVIVILFLLLSIVALADSYAPHINKMTEFFPEDALTATIKDVDDYENVLKETSRLAKLAKKAGYGDEAARVIGNHGIHYLAQDASFVYQLGWRDADSDGVADISDENTCHETLNKDCDWIPDEIDRNPNINDDLDFQTILRGLN